MEKKSFRPKKPASPSYPLLREVDHNTISRWGLATLGSLLLGGAGCTPAQADQPPPGEPPAVRIEQKADSKAARDESKAKSDETDKSTNTKANKRTAKTGKSEQAGVGATATKGNAAVPTRPDKPQIRRAGVPMRQRIEPATAEAGKTDPPKKDTPDKQAKGAKNAPQDGDQKDTASAPSKPKAEQTP